LDNSDDSKLRRQLPELIAVVGQLARQCDRAEHNEQTSRGLVLSVAEQLREMAIDLAGSQAAVVGAYAERIEQVELRHPLGGAGIFEGGRTIRDAKTWLDLQRAQVCHDSVYHADVSGLAKYDQLRHYTLHLAKLAWLMQQACDGDEDPQEEFLRLRVPDLFLFGIKLATVVGARLPEETLQLR
jgi:hypothetical protein